MVFGDPVTHSSISTIAVIPFPKATVTPTKFNIQKLVIFFEAGHFPNHRRTIMGHFSIASFPNSFGGVRTAKWNTHIYTTTIVYPNHHFWYPFIKFSEGFFSHFCSWKLLSCGAGGREVPSVMTSC